MAKQTLPTNFKDDVLNTSMSGKRKWNISQNSDGTYSITDVTTYDQVGSEFGAGELNATNQAVNASADAGKIIDDPDTAGATTQNGYIAGVQLFNHVNDSLANGQISFDVVDGEPYVAVNGGTPRPFDSRHFLVKSGVVQDGYELLNDNSSKHFSYNEDGYLKRESTSAWFGFKADITNYNRVCISLRGETNGLNTLHGYLSTTAFFGNKAQNMITPTYDVSALSGEYYFAWRYQSDTVIRVYDIWLEK